MVALGIALVFAGPAVAGTGASPNGASDVSRAAVAAAGQASPIGVGAGSQGAGYACVVKVTGRLTCWGTASGHASPPADAVSDVSVAGTHACAVGASTATVECWGATRVAPPPPTAVVALGVGPNADCVLTLTSALRCWGTPATPVVADVPSGRFRQVSVGATSACAIETTGPTLCWGAPDTGIVTGEPGDDLSDVVVGDTGAACGRRLTSTVECWGATAQVRAVPATLVVTALAVGGGYACAVRVGARVSCWGRTTAGALDAPTDTSAVALATGTAAVCALKVQGLPVCWGDIAYPPNASRAPYVDAGHPIVTAGDSPCALTTAGTIACSGDPADLPEPAGEFITIGASTSDVCALSVQGSVVCWIGTTLRVRPGPFVALSVGEFETCAVRVDGRVVCWGLTGIEGSPFGTQTVLQVAAGADGACVLLVTGRASCWNVPFLVEASPGGTPAGPPTPTVETGVYTTLSSYGFSACGLTPSFQVRCWGPEPTLVQPTSHGGRWVPIPTTSFVAVSVGRKNACGLRPTGHLVCWGTANREHEQPTPSQTFAEVAQGNTVCGLETDVKDVCWGATSGATGREVPVVVPLPILVTPSGSQSIGGGPTFSYVEETTAGSGITGSLQCSSLTTGPIRATLEPGSYTLDGGSCSGLTATPAFYTVSYADGPFVVQTPTISTDAALESAPGGRWTATDTVRTTGLVVVAGSMTGELLGPVAPGQGGCTGVTWSNAPVQSRFGPVAISDAAPYSTSSVQLTRQGCYTWTESIEAQGSTMDSPPGLPAETVEATLAPAAPAEPSVSPTSASAPVMLQVATTADANPSSRGGASVVDVVDVTGGTFTEVTVVAELLGPVPPRDGSCSAATWAGAPVAGVVAPFGLQRGIGTSTPAVVVSGAGCYSWMDTLVGTGAVIATSAAGQFDETVYVAQSKSATVTSPQTPSPSGRRQTRARPSTVGSVALWGARGAGSLLSISAVLLLVGAVRRMVVRRRRARGSSGEQPDG